MPYIKKEDRIGIDKALEALLGELHTKQENEVDGCINYAISTLLSKTYGPCYFYLNRAMGVLCCVQQEFYRRVIAPYEDKKAEENGDVF